MRMVMFRILARPEVEKGLVTFAGALRRYSLWIVIGTLIFVGLLASGTI